MRWSPFKMGRTDRERLVWILLGLMAVFSVPMCRGMTNPSDGKSKSNAHTTSEHELWTQLCPLCTWVRKQLCLELCAQTLRKPKALPLSSFALIPIYVCVQYLGCCWPIWVLPRQSKLLILQFVGPADLSKKIHAKNQILIGCWQCFQKRIWGSS